jgi:endonuclease/exonuclease/phosphatase family metal-dependent hydrolase
LFAIPRADCPLGSRTIGLGLINIGGFLPHHPVPRHQRNGIFLCTFRTGKQIVQMLQIRQLAVFAVIATLFFHPLSALEFTVLTYNVENLFDVDRVALFEDYAETGEENAYSPSKLLKKIQSISHVMKTFNGGRGPEVACFNEFEIDFTPDSSAGDLDLFLEKYRNTTVERMLTSELTEEIRGLPVEALLLKHLNDNGMTGYHAVVGADEPDLAAAQIYDRGANKKAHKNAVFSKFPIKETRSHKTPDARDILEVVLAVEGHTLIVFVNHWKSGASNFSSEQSRRFNAKTLRDRLEAILKDDPAADILISGDFNSQYNQLQIYPFMGQTGLNTVLGSQGDEKATAVSSSYSLYNLWYELPPEQRRSDHYSGKWGTLMQKMITPGLYDYRGVQYVDNSFDVVLVDGINTVTPFKLPKRWSNRGDGSGASDHFPISARFRTVDNGDTSRRIKLESNRKGDAPRELFKINLNSIRPEDTPIFRNEAVAEASKHMGEIFRVTGTIVSLKPLTLGVDGKEYLLWSPKIELRKRMQNYPKDGRVSILGEFGQHKNKLQFIVADPSWLLQEPEGKKAE